MNDRKTDNLLNAIGALPDFLIDESAEGSEEMKNRNITKWATVAAVFVFVTLTCVILAFHGNSAVVTPSDTDNAASESSETSSPESDPATESTSAPESTSAQESTSTPETTETEPPEEPEISREVFRIESSMISFPAAPKSERTKNMLANGNILDAQGEKPHCAVFSVHTVDDLEFLKEEILTPDTDTGFGIFESKSARFDEEFFSENTLYISFVEAPEYGGATVFPAVNGYGGAIEISFDFFPQVGDFKYSTEPYCVFLTVPNSLADNLTTVDCTYGSGEYGRIDSFKCVVTKKTATTTTVREIDYKGNIFSDSGSLTLRFVDNELRLGSIVEIAYDGRSATFSGGDLYINKIIGFRTLEMEEIRVPDTRVGEEKPTDLIVDAKEGDALMKNSGLNINNRSEDPEQKPVFGITSEKDLEAFCKLLADAAALDTGKNYSPGKLSQMYKKAYDEYSAEYDESFFKSHSLLVVYFTKGDIAYQLIPCKAKYGWNGTFDIDVCCIVPNVGSREEAASCVFIPVEKDDLENCTGVSVKYAEVRLTYDENGESDLDHIIRTKAVVTESSEDTATLRLLDKDGSILSDAGTVTLGSVDGRLRVNSAVEIVYDDRIAGNTNGHIEKVISLWTLDLYDLDLPEAIGRERGTACFIETEEGYDLIKNSELNINRRSPTFERSVFGISSTEELAEFCRLLFDAMMLDPDYSLSSVYTPERVAEMYAEEYGSFSEEYDEEFFKTRSLLIMYELEGDNSMWYRPTKLEYGEDGTIAVGLFHVTPSMMLCEEGAVCVFVPVEKDALKNCTGVSVDVVEINDWYE